MHYTQTISSPLGNILLSADEVGLTGLWFDGAKYFADGLPAEHTERETPVLSEARRWLDLYFAGQEPGFLPPLHPAGSAFQQAVWALLLPVIIIGGMKTGMFTPTEAAVVAAVVALLVSVFIYREMKFSDLPAILLASAKTASTIMLIVAASMVSAAAR